jgi:hypothetical protein
MNALRRRPSRSPRTPHTAQLTLVFRYANECIPHASRGRPPEASRRRPVVPASQRAKILLTADIPPPIPARPGTTKTGLSRRRSRVRVPSARTLRRCTHSSRASSSAVSEGAFAAEYAAAAARGVFDATVACPQPGPRSRVIQSGHRRCLPKRARPRPGRTNKQRVTPPRPIWCERAAIPARGFRYAAHQGRHGPSGRATPFA